MSCVLGCPYEGNISPEAVTKVCCHMPVCIHGIRSHVISGHVIRGHVIRGHVIKGHVPMLLLLVF